MQRQRFRIEFDNDPDIDSELVRRIGGHSRNGVDISSIVVRAPFKGEPIVVRANMVEVDGAKILERAWERPNVFVNSQLPEQIMSSLIALATMWEGIPPDRILYFYNLDPTARVTPYIVSRFKRIQNPAALSKKILQLGRLVACPAEQVVVPLNKQPEIGGLNTTTIMRFYKRASEFFRQHDIGFSDEHGGFHMGTLDFAIAIARDNRLIRLLRHWGTKKAVGDRFVAR